MYWLLLLIVFEDHVGPMDLGSLTIVFLYKHVVPTALNLKEEYRRKIIKCIYIDKPSVCQVGLQYYAFSALVQFQKKSLNATALRMG